MAADTSRSATVNFDHRWHPAPTILQTQRAVLNLSGTFGDGAALASKPDLARTASRTQGHQKFLDLIRTLIRAMFMRVNAKCGHQMRPTAARAGEVG